MQDKEAVRAGYDRISRVYGLLSNGSEKKFGEVAIERLLAPVEGEVVLEPGFGTGQVLLALAEKVGDTGRVYGIDVSDGMMEATRRRLEKAGLSERAVLTRGDAARMPYEDRFFDAIFMSFTLELFPDEEIPVVLKECMRVLKSGGRLCVACMSKKGKRGIMVKLYAWSHRRFPGFVDCRPIFAGQAVENAGFTAVDGTVMSMWGLPVEILLATTRNTGVRSLCCV